MEIGMRRLTILLVMCLPGLGSAQVFKWVDEKGNVHFGDRPKRADAQEIVVQPSTPSADPAAAKQRLEQQKKLLNAYQAERASKREELAKNKQQALEKKQNCAAARDQLRRYRQAGYLYGLDKDGNRVVYNDERRQQETHQARSEVDKWCN